MTGNKNHDVQRKPSASAPARKPKKRRFIVLKLLVFIIVCIVVATSFAQRGYKYIVDGSEQATVLMAETTASEKEKTGLLGGNRVEFKIPYGSSTTDIATQLMDEGFLKRISVFKLMSKLIGFDGLYKSGRYIIEKGMNEYALMLVLTGDALKNPSVDVRIPEGMTVVELADYLVSQNLIVKEKFIKLCEMHLKQFTFQSDLVIAESRKYPLEGYLYPDTYKMDEGWDEEKLVLRTLDEFNRVFSEDDKKRAVELGMTTDEVVTLASLIEMEALHPTDLKKISSVFHNRLNSKDLTLLQSDATIQYALVMAGIGRKTTVLYKDLEIDSPYNTYIHPGLPPGPVCSPRKDAIEAALYPEKTKYYYFFAAPDGTNIYNETYDGHLKDQQKYGVSGN